MTDEIGLRTEVNSEQIRSLAYDRQLSRLEIEFKSGGVYQYDHVPPNLVVDLTTAESIGTFFAAYIKNVFTCYRLIDGVRTALADVKGTDKSKGFMYGLAKKLGLVTDGYITSAWRAAIRGAGLTPPTPETRVHDYVDSLRQSEVSLLVNYFKERT